MLSYVVTVPVMQFARLRKLRYF